MTEARIFLARHGRTDWNTARRRQGRENIPLNPEGCEDAQALRRALTHERLDAVFSSPLARALDTAGPAARAHALPVIVDDDLLELDFGVFSGSVRGEVKVRLSKTYLYEPVPGGESLFDAWQRAARFAQRIEPALLAGHTLLIVGHQRLNRLLLGVLQSSTLEAAAKSNAYRPAPGSLVKIQFQIQNERLQVRTVDGDTNESLAD